MAWFEKQSWFHQRASLEREALAASVEEIVALNEQGVDAWDGSGEDDLPGGSAPIIPPRLRLQSRPLPVVRVTRRRTGQAAHERSLPGSYPFAQSQMLAARPRLAGRSTRVHLQAVRLGKVQEPGTEQIFPGDTVSLGLSSASVYSEPFTGDGVLPALQLEAPGTASPMKGGKGEIEPGQRDVMVPNAAISEQSVVIVMLASDPGPVVVHYVSLHPRTGFTVHLSSPAAALTSFHYMIRDLPG